MADAGGNIATAGSGLDLGSATSLDRAVSAAQASAAKSMSEYAGATKAAAARGAERQKTLDAIVADMPAHADFAKLAGEIPSAPKLPEQPAMPQGNAWQNFGSTASVLGILGSMLLKLPIRDSLNASAAAMNAKTKGDWADYQANYARWKDATDLAIKQADWESKRFAEALDLMKSDSAAGEAAARTVAAATNNDAAMAVLQSGDPKLQAEYFDGLAKLSESMQAHADAVEMQHQRLIEGQFGTPVQVAVPGPDGFLQQRTAVWDKLNRHWVDPKTNEVIAGNPESLGPNAPPLFDMATLMRIAKQYVGGNERVLSNLGFSNYANRYNMQKAITQVGEESGMSAQAINEKLAQFAAYTQGQKALGTRAANIGVGLHEFKNFAPVAKELSSKVDRSKFTTLSSIEQAVSRGFSDPDTVNFFVTNQEMINAYAQVVGRGNSRVTDAARKFATDTLNTAWAKGTYNSAIDLLENLGDKALQATNDTQKDLKAFLDDKLGQTTQPRVWKFTATGPGGKKIYSDDQEHWFNADGSTYGAK